MMPYKDPEKERAYRRQRYALGLSGHDRYFAENRDEILAKHKARYERDKETVLEKMLVRLYGVTRAQYNNLLETQDGGCAVCGGVPPDRRLAVDHDHNTGDVRGLLCGNCNRAIGQFQDNPDLLDKAAAYLRKHRRV